MTKNIFVVDFDGKPLMPMQKVGKVRRMLKGGEAKILRHSPFFTIQLLRLTKKTITRHLTLGIDTGYNYIGYSVIDSKTKKEIIGGQLELDIKMPKRLEARSMYRTNRRNRLRHRKAKFDNRKRKAGWLPPSTKRQVETHIKLINKLVEILPIQTINLELGNFDMAKINNPDIKGVEYQNGVQHGFDNVRAAVLYRDKHKCQNPNCKNEDKNITLEVHHIVYRSFGGTDSPNNLITLCSKCHNQKNHKENGFLYQWMKTKKKAGTLKEATFMNILKKYLYEDLVTKYTMPINITYGYITKEIRLQNGIKKTHHNDAFIIAGGVDASLITEDCNFKQERRNNRSLETFRDAKYIDSRTGEEKSGQELNCGRHTRNKNKNTENEKQFRVVIIDEKTNKRKEITKGKRSLKKQIAKIPKNSIIYITENWSNKKGNVIVKKGQKFTTLGMKSLGKYVYINIKEKKEQIPEKICKLIAKRNGFIPV